MKSLLEGIFYFPFSKKEIRQKVAEVMRSAKMREGKGISRKRKCEKF
jgi:hypothetical protein